MDRNGSVTSAPFALRNSVVAPPSSSSRDWQTTA